MQTEPTQPIQFEVNGRPVHVAGGADRRLLEALREELDLTGTKYGCGEGQCGACTVLVDGQPVRSCITLLDQVAGKHVTTIEGLATADALHPVQQAFIDSGAVQCGYCTPGMILSAVALLQRDSQPTHDDVVAAMNGNMCRCCGYARIVAAIQRVVGEAAGEATR